MLPVHSLGEDSDINRFRAVQTGMQNLSKPWVEGCGRILIQRSYSLVGSLFIVTYVMCCPSLKLRHCQVAAVPFARKRPYV